MNLKDPERQARNVQESVYFQGMGITFELEILHKINFNWEHLSVSFMSPLSLICISLMDACKLCVLGNCPIVYSKL